MVYKIWQAVKKEMLLLSRDLGGLITLFVMPIVLVITVTLIQKSSFDTLNNEATEVLWIDNDQDSLSFKIKNQIEQAGVFKLVTHKNQEIITENVAQTMVKRGEYQLAFVLPKNLTHDLNSKVDFNVAKVLEQFSFSEDVDTTATAPTPLQPKIIKMYFDPATQSVFKNGVINAIEKYVSQIENKAIYEAFQHELGDSETTDFAFNSEPFIVFNELSPIANESIKPNAVQHNVPAWTLFAIFFIIVPLSINIVKEKNQGTLVRLLSSPSPTYLILSGKVITYLVISLLQFYAMLAIGKFLFPYLGLPSLSLEGRFFALSLVALFSGLAAIGFGVLLGTIAKTQEQAAPFGATFVIILAAIGGVWIPVFAMPSFMQFIAVISPMHWGLEGFYDVLLRKASIIDMLPKIILLLLFFIVTFVVALVYDKKKDIYNSEECLTDTHQIRIRFNECDPLGIVWHGNYIKYFEDGREAFCEKHGISYLDVQRNGFATPIVKSSCEHKATLKYGDVATIETTFINTAAAKVVFKYKIFNPEGKLACLGETIQVFIDNDGVLQLSNPDFYQNWKKKVGF